VELITEYLERTLPKAGRIRFGQYLSVCPGSQEYLEQMRLMIKTLGSIGEDRSSRGEKNVLLEAFQDWEKNA